MGADLAVLCFEADLEEVMAAPDVERWKLKRGDPLELLAIMCPSRAPTEQFHPRFLWVEYPGLPSLKFRDPVTGRLDNPRAWPQCPGFRPSSLDTCVSWTVEGHALHPEWRTAPATRFDRSGNAIYRALCNLQDTLDLSFQGRCAA